MENAQPILATTPVNLIILPASSSLPQQLQPLTVITTTALNTLSSHHHPQPVTTATINNNNNGSGSSPSSNSAAASAAVVTSVVPAVSGSAGAAAGTPKTYSGTPPLKPAKKFRSEQEEILRCKRRLDFVGPLVGLQQRPHAATVLRRNERERNRVKLINNTFVRLREHLPGAANVKTSKGKTKKLSKVDTLQGAIEYIRALKDLIDEHDAVNAAFDSGVLSPSLGQRTVSSSCSTSSPTSSSPSTSSSSSSSSPASDAVSLHSPGSTGDVETFSDDAPLSPEEVDLLDFTTWF